MDAPPPPQSPELPELPGSPQPRRVQLRCGPGSCCAAVAAALRPRVRGAGAFLPGFCEPTLGAALAHGRRSECAVSTDVWTCGRRLLRTEGAAALLLLLLLFALAATIADERASYEAGLPPPPSLRALATFSACSPAARLSFGYRRTTVTPILFVHDRGAHAPPCAVLKLSCRVSPTAAALSAVNDNWNHRHPPWYDGAWADVAAQALLEALSPAHYTGRGSGAVLVHAGAALLKSVPAECIWRGGVSGDLLLGAVVDYVPGLITARINAEVLSRWVGHPSSMRAIASTWIVDALTLNRDRKGGHNIFVGRDGLLTPMDFSAWVAGCNEASYTSVRAQAQLPTLGRGVLNSSAQLCGDRDWRRALEATVAMAAEACGNHHDGGGNAVDDQCPRLVARMQARLIGDPYFELAARAPVLFRTLCFSGGSHRSHHLCVTAGAADDDVRSILQRVIPHSCLERHGRTAADYLSSLTASRLSVFIEAAREQLAAC